MNILDIARQNQEKAWQVIKNRKMQVQESIW